MFGIDQRCHGDARFARFVESLKNVDAEKCRLEAIRDQARDQATIATETIRNYNKIYTDTRSKKPSIYSEGDYVMIRKHTIRTW